MGSLFNHQNVGAFFKAINTCQCPICQSKLCVDDQKDSIYVSCENNSLHFEIAGFKDLYTGNLALIYLNKDDYGIINNSVLKKFQKIIYRKLLASKE